jgi:hypothetical protein
MSERFIQTRLRYIGLKHEEQAAAITNPRDYQKQNSLLSLELDYYYIINLTICLRTTTPPYLQAGRA